MTQTFWVLPEMHVADKKPSKSRRGRSYSGRPKYDHWQMIQDRLAGMTWEDIAAKHGIKANSHPAGALARRLVDRSVATQRLTPQEVRRLDAVPRGRSGKIPT